MFFATPCHAKRDCTKTEHTRTPSLVGAGGIPVVDVVGVSAAAVVVVAAAAVRRERFDDGSCRERLKADSYPFLRETHV